MFVHFTACETLQLCHTSMQVMGYMTVH
uniref:Uncharacterized protein n=1 Tax=Anguilla anguilla TaxID=7936 RepID=A0A0E9PL69_ANGAN